VTTDSSIRVNRLHPQTTSQFGPGSAPSRSAPCTRTQAA
jgi:hypothetical protein